MHSTKANLLRRHNPTSLSVIMGFCGFYHFHQRIQSALQPWHHHHQRLFLLLQFFLLLLTSRRNMSSTRIHKHTFISFCDDCNVLRFEYFLVNIIKIGAHLYKQRWFSWEFEMFWKRTEERKKISRAEQSIKCKNGNGGSSTTVQWHTNECVNTWTTKIWLRSEAKPHLKAFHATALFSLSLIPSHLSLFFQSHVRTEWKNSCKMLAGLSKMRLTSRHNPDIFSLFSAEFIQIVRSSPSSQCLHRNCEKI